MEVFARRDAGRPDGLLLPPRHETHDVPAELDAAALRDDTPPFVVCCHGEIDVFRWVLWGGVMMIERERNGLLGCEKERDEKRRRGKRYQDIRKHRV
jgi:hypothetical protein